MQMKTLSKA